jgi:hypothetical protein
MGWKGRTSLKIGEGLGEDGHDASPKVETDVERIGVEADWDKVAYDQFEENTEPLGILRRGSKWSER